MAKYRSIYSSDWEDDYYDDYDSYTGYSDREAITTSKWSDWYNRDSFGGTKKKHTSTLGWDKKVKYGGSYSSYFLGDSYYSKSFKSGKEGNLDFLKKCYPQAKDLITILDLPFKVNIQISEGSSSFSDGRRVCVATDMFDNPDINEAEKLDVFCGVTVHEGAHLMFTSFSDLESWLESQEGGYTQKVYAIKQLANIIEDERIEDQLSLARPGLSGFLEKSKYYYFDQLYRDQMAQKMNEYEDNEERTELSKFLDLMFKVIRYPKYIDSECADQNKERLEKLKTWIVPLPKDTKSTIDTAIKIYEFLVEEFGSSMINSTFQNLENILDNMFPVPMYGKDEDNISNGLPDNRVSSDIKSSSEYEVKSVEGSVEVGESKNSYFVKEKVDKNSKHIYQYHLGRIKNYIPAIRKLVKNTDKNYDFVVKSCRHGLLDTNKLAEAYQGIPQVYQRKGTVTTNSTTVCVLVDESGSMGSYSKDTYARDAVVLLNEALGKLSGVDLYIYGHTADEDSYAMGSSLYDTELIVYREGKHFVPKYSLGNIHARSENRDGVAILEVAKRVRKNTQQPVLMFVISDGSPCAIDYRGEGAVTDTRDKVKIVEAMGFNIVQITIDECPYAGQMFSKYIDLSGNISNMPIMLAKIIKKCVLDDKVTKVL